jgi:hypothetical protein
VGATGTVYPHMIDLHYCAAWLDRSHEESARRGWRDHLLPFLVLACLTLPGPCHGVLSRAWQMPAVPQIRQLLTEYCILPMGDPEVKAKLKPGDAIKTVLLFGPSGAGT